VLYLIFHCAFLNHFKVCFFFSMFMFFVYVEICSYLYIYICIYIYIHLYTHPHTYIHTYIHVIGWMIKSYVDMAFSRLSDQSLRKASSELCSGNKMHVCKYFYQQFEWANKPDWEAVSYYPVLICQGRYICIFTYIYMCMFVKVDIDIYVCLYMCMYMCTHMCMDVFMYRCMCICIHEIGKRCRIVQYLFVKLDIYICTHVSIYTYVNILHTYTLYLYIIIYK
jgi:hypothetical protein